MWKHLNNDRIILQTVLLKKHQENCFENSSALSANKSMTEVLRLTLHHLNLCELFSVFKVLKYSFFRQK